MRQDAFEYALRMVVAQAKTRPMNVDEIIALMKDLTSSFTDLIEGRTEKSMEAQTESEPEVITPVMDPRKSIKERTVTCLVCGKQFKVLTAKHLALHGFDSADEYCGHFGLKKGTPLVCKSLLKMRKDKMNSMKLWERRHKKVEQPVELPVELPAAEAVPVRKRASRNRAKAADAAPSDEA